MRMRDWVLVLVGIALGVLGVVGEAEEYRTVNYDGYEMYSGPTDRVPFAHNCIVTGLDVPVRNGKEIRFSIESRDINNQPLPYGGFIFNVSVTGHGEVFTGTIFDMKNGRYELNLVVFFTATTTDVVTVNVTHKGDPLRNGPFRLPVEGAFEHYTTGDPASAPYCEDVRVVTGGNADFYEAVENFVASFQVWEPHRILTVYDFGLTHDQRDYFRLLRNVELRTLDFSKFGAHIAQLGTYAFKPIVIKEMIQLFDCVLWLDSGAEIRKPLDEIIESLKWDGHWMTTTGWRFPNKYTHPDSLVSFNLTVEDLTNVDDVRLEAPGGLIGFDRRAPAYLNVLVPWVECCLREHCIAPPGLTRDNYRQDQTILNIILHRGPLRFRQRIENKYYGWYPHSLPLITQNPLEQNDIVLFLRRRFHPKPYSPLAAMKNETEVEAILEEIHRDHRIRQAVEEGDCCSCVAH